MGKWLPYATKNRQPVESGNVIDPRALCKRYTYFITSTWHFDQVRQPSHALDDELEACGSAMIRLIL